MLWWGWLGFSAGSTFGITGHKWKFSARSSMTTILSSMGGGSIGMIISFYTRNGLQDINMLLDPIIASLVAIWGGAPIFLPIYAILIGGIAAFLVLIPIPLIEKLRIDDPTIRLPHTQLLAPGVWLLSDFLRV